MTGCLSNLPQSESKANFIAKLGLDLKCEAHFRLYSQMKNEAAAGRERIIIKMKERGLCPANGMYSTSSIPEDLLIAECREIHMNAIKDGSITFWLYNLARQASDSTQPNWIVRWMLWHVLRYRDGRQKKAFRAACSATDEGYADTGGRRIPIRIRADSDETGIRRSSLSRASPARSSPVGHGSRKGSYSGARNRSRSRSADSNTPPRRDNNYRSAHETNERREDAMFDPVRDRWRSHTFRR